MNVGKLTTDWRRIIIISIVKRRLPNLPEGDQTLIHSGNGLEN